MSHVADPLSPPSLAKLRHRCRGEVITPDHPAYEEARRVWNGMIDRRPAVIIRCLDAPDVAAAIALARDGDLPLAVRGGGHSAPGFGVCDGGVVVDLSAMRDVRVDSTQRRAIAGGGALWADVDTATQEHGLAVTGGLVTHTGIGGLTLGGGIGHLMRRCGLACDNLLAAEVVTADGDVVRAGEEGDPDLLWALQGGGGNFGVVTRFEYRLHEVGPIVLAGALMYPPEDGLAILRLYREWAPTIPDQMGTVVAFRSAPPSPLIPPDVHEREVVAIVVCWSGPLDEGERVLEPLRRGPRPIVDLVGLRPYLQLQGMFDHSAPHGRQNYKRNANLSSLPDEVLEVLVERNHRRTSPLSMTLLFQLGGAVARVPDDAAAYSDRAAPFVADINAQWTDTADPRTEEHVRWVRDLHEALRPHGTGGAYVNFLMGDEGPDRLRATYGSASYERLITLKRRYDPENTFRLNQNLEPCP